MEKGTLSLKNRDAPYVHETKYFISNLRYQKDGGDTATNFSTKFNLFETLSTRTLHAGYVFLYFSQKYEGLPHERDCG